LNFLPENSAAMKHCRLPLSLGLALTFVLSANAQLPPDKAEATFKVADGLEFKLWASEPLFVNPTCMDIDHKGRVWVCESVNYRDTLHHRPLRRPAGDRIVILEDTKGLGKADRATTFYQAPELLAPLGIAVAKDPVGPGYKVYVCQSPNILLFEDKDGDGKADGPPKKLLTGFRGIDHDHGVHGIRIGPDGKLYFSVGDQGVENLQSSDGKGRKWTTNHTDCQAGTIWRCDMDGKNLELIAHNFRNEYEPCVDSFGTIFVSDNDDDGNQQTRICYVMPGGNYGYWPRGPGQSHWHEEQPGVVPKILRTYFGSPTGMCVYEGTLLPKKYWGQLLHTDAGPRHVRCYHLRPQGAGYAVEREDIVTGTDTWFRPSDICVAPDGSVFVSDWYDPGVGGHGMGDTSRGRIYRLAPQGYKPSVPKIDVERVEGLQAALASPNLAVRHIAMAKLRTLDTNAAQEVCEKTLGRTDAVRFRARILWQLAALAEPLGERARKATGLGGELQKLRFGSFIKMRTAAIKAALKDPDPQIRTAAIRICHDYFDAFAETISNSSLFDNSPAVCREALLAIRDKIPTQLVAYFYNLAKKYDGKDRFYLEAIGIAVGHEPKRREVLLADFDIGFPEWNEQVANLIWELRPPQSMARLEKRLADPTTPTQQRVQIVDIFAASEDTSGVKALLKLLQSDPPGDVRNRIIDNLMQSLPGKWRDLRQTKELTDALDYMFNRPETVTIALELAAAAADTQSVGKVAAIATDAKQPAQTRVSAVHTLGALPCAEAVRALTGMLAYEPNPLFQDIFQALGQQVQAQPKRATDSPALKVLQNLVNSGDQYPHVRQTAARTLAETRVGGLWLLDANGKNTLPDFVKAEIGRILRNSPYKDVRDKAFAAFPPPAKLDPKRLPGPAALAKRRGNADRGKELLAVSVKSNLQCLKCHTIQGVGGKVGPDLSVIGKKASRENLFESILLPSKAIADQYVSWVVETKKGLVLTGLLVQETPDSITLRDANAKDTRIDKKEIETRSKSLVSLMPSDLLSYMTEEDLVDMVEYLFTLK
jgi:putative membrane-bound dehydrogenase-like protein